MKIKKFANKKIDKKNESKEKEKPQHYKNIVIGAGLSGLTFANKIAETGEKILLIDKSMPGIKSSLNIKIFAQMAKEAKLLKVDDKMFFNSFAFRLNSLNKKINEDNDLNNLKRKGIDFIQGEVEIIDENTLKINEIIFNFKNLIFATGSHFDNSNIKKDFESFFMNSGEINKISKKYNSIAIYGTNGDALELAKSFSNLGTKVYLIDRFVNPFNDFDDEVEAILRKEYILDSNIEWCLEFIPSDFLRVSDDSVQIKLKNNKEERTIEVEKIILTENKVPSTNFNSKRDLKKNSQNAFIIDRNFKMKGNTNFFAIGEVNGIQKYANQSENQATILANYMLGYKSEKFDTKNTIWSLNTQPNISFFGMNKREIQNEGIEFNEFIYDFKGNFQSINDDIGRIKVFTNMKHELLGIILIGEELNEFTLLFSLMKQNKTKFYQMGDFNVPFFTKSEALRSATLAYRKEFVNISKKDKKLKNN